MLWLKAETFPSGSLGASKPSADSAEAGGFAHAWGYKAAPFLRGSRLGKAYLGRPRPLLFAVPALVVALVGSELAGAVAPSSLPPFLSGVRPRAAAFSSRAPRA